MPHCATAELVASAACADTVDVDNTGQGRWRGDSTAVIAVLAAAAALAVLIANVAGIATGDDGVGYRAIADSLLAGHGYGYFLEDPVTVWPPVWPSLMAFVAWISPLDTLGAAIVLNAAMAAGVVVAGNRLLRKVVSDPRLVLAGTIVLALGPSTIGLGHVLMTDMAFALVTMVWMLTLIRFRRTGVAPGPGRCGAAGLGGLRPALHRPGAHRLRRAVAAARRTPEPGDPLPQRLLYGVVAAIAPVAWMLRNHSIDGTYTGERNPSARGLIDNGFDEAATLGRFLLPGLGNGMTKVWAAVGLVVLAIAAWLAWRVLSDGPVAPPGARAPGRLLGRPMGLLLSFAVLYMLYMLYVRTTTALNQLDLRLLYPAYFPLMFVALALAGAAAPARHRRTPLGAAGAGRRCGVGDLERARRHGRHGRVRCGSSVLQRQLRVRHLRRGARRTRPSPRSPTTASCTRTCPTGCTRPTSRCGAPSVVRWSPVARSRIWPRSPRRSTTPRRAWSGSTSLRCTGTSGRSSS